VNGLLTVGSGHQWESELVAALDKPGTTFVVVRRCADVADLLATAQTGRAVVAVVDGGVRRLDSAAVDRLNAAGVAVVAVCEPGDTRTVHRLRLIGVSFLVDADATTAAMVTAADAAIAALAESGAAWVGDPRRALGRGNSADPPGGATRPYRAPTGPSALGRVVAVWGPAGAPGRSTVAMGLADASAVLGLRTLLVDADVYGGVLANAFGLLDESPGLAGSCRLAANGRLEEAELERLSWSIGPQLGLLTGITRPDRWPEVRPSAVPTVLAVARRLSDLTVVDCGFSIESDEELSYDTVAPRRNGATLAVLADADTVLVVGAADPPGMERLVRGLTELADVLPQVRPLVVLNRLRSSAAGFDEAATALRRFTRVEPLLGLPEDRRATDAAWSAGSTLSKAAAGSALRSVLDKLVRILVPTAGAVRPAVVPR